ncbi:MAG: nucleoside:proton symporter [Proteobacteria bacterium]|nr:nucleoside:proton symporter [Pseudomonadota bacterium]
MAWRSALGFLALAGVAWALSEDRHRIRARLVAAGLLLQVGLGALLLKLPPAKAAFLTLNRAILSLEEATTAGTSFVFGYLGGGSFPAEVTNPGASFVLAFRALPLVLVMSALSALLFHWKVLPLVVRGFSWALARSLGIGGALGLAAAANVFVGMVEAPLLVRPYLREMDRGELFAVMTCGMATIAGTVLALYASILRETIPGAVGHILTASLISAPAALTVAHLMVPHRGEPTRGELQHPDRSGSSMEAITRGTTDGVALLLNIVALLVVLVALVSLANQVLGLLPEIGGASLSLQRLLGLAMAPVVWLMGIPWAEAPTAGALMGTKTILNELLAYLDLAALPAGALSPRSRLIMTYALCGFANFGSLGIMIGGLGAMAPERKEEVVGLGLKSLVSGTLATLMTGAVVGML